MPMRIRLRIAVAVLIGFSLQAPITRGQTPEDSPPRSTAELADRLGVRTLTKGTSGRAEKRAALAALPLARMTPQHRARVNLVLDSVSQFRSLPTIQTSIEPEVYHYFLKHPDVAVSLWRVMKISEFQLWQTGSLNYEADAGDGSEGVSDFVYRDDRQCVVVCEGVYKNPVLTRPIKARAVVHVRFDFQPGPPGEAATVTQKINAFVSFPSTAVKTVAKVISPVTNRIMDRNCSEITVFVKVMSDSMQTRPQWVRGMAGQMDGVLPARRTELADLAARINTQARARNVQTYLGRGRKPDPLKNLPLITAPSGTAIRNASQRR